MPVPSADSLLEEGTVLVIQSCIEPLQVLNEGREIGAKLDWLRENLSPSPLEVIVVDGGSNDHTVAVAEQAGGIRVLSSARSRARQMNAGARAAKGAKPHRSSTLCADAIDLRRLSAISSYTLNRERKVEDGTAT